MTWELRGAGLTMAYAVGGGLYGGPRRRLLAVDDVSLRILRGRTLGLVGESGCGKSTAGRILAGLLKPTAGRVFLGDLDLARVGGAERRRLRREVQMIFQDPASALNPHLTLRQALEEPFEIHEPDLPLADREARIQALVSRVGLGGALLERLPGALSGGQRQRVVIARALALGPAFLFADEPVASLDVSVRAQVLNLLVELQRERNLGCLFVSHDLQVVRHLADAVAVMYLGRIVEHRQAGAFFQAPLHPYAQALCSAIPGGDRPRIILEGEAPSPLEQPRGCPFQPRCPRFAGLSAQERSRCLGERPLLSPVPGEPAGAVACHFPQSPSPSGGTGQMPVPGISRPAP